jgi:hypothetical protein
MAYKVEEFQSDREARNERFRVLRGIGTKGLAKFTQDVRVEPDSPTNFKTKVVYLLGYPTGSIEIQVKSESEPPTEVEINVAATEISEIDGLIAASSKPAQPLDEAEAVGVITSEPVVQEATTENAPDELTPP